MREVFEGTGRVIKGAWLEIIDTTTGETRRYRDDLFDPDPESGSEYLWSEGNYGCDCNRALFFARAAGEPDPSWTGSRCEDSRYHVPRANCDDGTTVEIDGDR